MATAAVLCFFPVMVNTLRGLTSVRPSQVELMRSYAARGARDLPPRPDPDRAAVRLRRVESRDGTRDDRCHRERLLRGTFGSLGITIRTPSPCSTSRRRGLRSSWPASRCRDVRRRLARRTPRPPLGSITVRKRGQQSRWSQESQESGRMKRVAWSRQLARARRLVGACRRARRRPPEAHQGDPPAEVGDAVAVRRLLRSRREGLLQAGRPRRAAQGGRPGHHAGAGRALRPGRVRPRLAPEPVRDAREGRQDRLDRPGLRALAA